MRPVRLVAWACLLLAGCNRSTPLEIHDPAVHHVRMMTTSELKAHMLVLNFWAPWCKPCREEIPQLNQFAASHAASVVVLAVNFDHPEGDALPDAAGQAGIHYPSLVTDPATLFKLPEITGLPTTIVFNDQRTVLAVLPGPQTEATLDAAVNPAGH